MNQQESDLGNATANIVDVQEHKSLVTNKLENFEDGLDAVVIDIPSRPLGKHVDEHKFRKGDSVSE